jgi:hypothetical protein
MNCRHEFGHWPESAGLGDAQTAKKIRDLAITY